MTAPAPADSPAPAGVQAPAVASEPTPVQPLPPRAPVSGAPPAALPTATNEEYRIGEEDELTISVYGDTELAATQTVRPGGRIAFPLIGDIKASGLTADELRRQITARISRYRRDPQVTVIVGKFNSKKINILGQVKAPGLLRLGPDISLLEAISRAGGLTPDADLRGALLIRNGQIQPVDFDKLLRRGDFSQNVLLRSHDTILIPDINDKKVFVLGQVHRPLVVALTPEITLVESISRAGGLTEDADLQGALLIRAGQSQPVNFDKLLRQGDASQNMRLEANDVVLVPSIKDKKVFVLGEVIRPVTVPVRGAGLTLVESIALAGGFTPDAKTKTVVIVRGGLGDPKLLTVNVDAMTRDDGQAGRNVALEPGDIVYVPRTIVADVLKFFRNLTTILTPFIMAESGIVLGPAMQAVFAGQATTNTIVQPVVVGR